MLTLNERLDVLTKLGAYLQEKDERLEAHIHRASVSNGWFTHEAIHDALEQIAVKMLQRRELDQWINGYSFVEPTSPGTVGVVAAGNIPLVAWHDVLSVFVSGNISKVKLSDKDQYLIPFLTNIIGEYDQRANTYFEYVDKLQDFDAVIATGSNNTARYFEQYFGAYPNIIRKNRNGIAVLTGDETTDDLVKLGKDVFAYFGLGCRNVSHLLVPQGYDFGAMEEAFAEYKDAAQHSKYRNNLDYNLALKILNKDKYLGWESIMLLESEQLASPVSCLNYQYYDDINWVSQFVANKKEEIQCVVSGASIPDVQTVTLGKSQSPALNDYADGVDVLDFLIAFNLR